MTEWFQGFLGYGFGWFVATIVLILMIVLPLLLAVAMIIYADRKILAAIMLRRGPNVVGPFGLLQSFADGLKVFLQETIIPSAANRALFLLAPIIMFTVALNATRLMFTASRMSSIAIRMMMMFFRFRKMPSTPITNRIAATTR